MWLHKAAHFLLLMYLLATGVPRLFHAMPSAQVCVPLWHKSATQLAVMHVANALPSRASLATGLRKCWSTYIPSRSTLDLLCGAQVSVALSGVTIPGSPYNVTIKSAPADPMRTVVTYRLPTGTYQPAATSANVTAGDTWRVYMTARDAFDNVKFDADADAFNVSFRRSGVSAVAFGPPQRSYESADIFADPPRVFYYAMNLTVRCFPGWVLVMLVVPLRVETLSGCVMQ